MRTQIEPFYRDLGRRVREARRQCNPPLTQEGLGNRLVPPMTRAAIANIETAKQRVLTHTVCQLAGALGLTPNDLLSDMLAQPNAGSAAPSLETEFREELRLAPGKIRRLVAHIEKSKGARR